MPEKKINKLSLHFHLLSQEAAAWNKFVKRKMAEKLSYVETSQMEIALQIENWRCSGLVVPGKGADDDDAAAALINVP